MKVYFASDHAGFELKNILVSFVLSLGYEVEDMGPSLYNEDDDYPDTILPLAKSISKEPEGCFGIIIGGSGQGEAIIANRIKNIRAGVYYGGNLSIIEKLREHNDANVLSFGARFIDEVEAKESVKIFLETPFSDEERHQRRIEKIDNLT